MKKAFSLVELIIVLVIISVGLGTLLMAVRLANVNNANSQFMTVALEMAKGKIEEILYDRMKYGFGYINNSKYPPENPPSVAGFGNYKREVDIIYVNLSNLNNPAGSQTDYKRVKVTVTSRVGIQGKAESVTIISNCE